MKKAMTYARPRTTLLQWKNRLAGRCIACGKRKLVNAVHCKECRARHNKTQKRTHAKRVSTLEGRLAYNARKREEDRRRRERNGAVRRNGST